MNRRNFARAAAAASLAGAAAAAPPKSSYIELRVFRLRNGADNQRQRLTEFLQKQGVPGLERAGAGKVGVFAPMISQDSPFLMTVTPYPSLAAYEASMEKIAMDREFQAAHAALDASGAAYTRMETSLLRAFSAMPNIEYPPVEGRKGSRVFELRTYESPSMSTLMRKVGMFASGEIAIFRKTGLLPVFFGTTTFGRNMPNLVYMVAFDDLAARERNWRAFAGDPEWLKLRAQPGLSDAEIVSNISNSILTALPFSAIR